MHSWLNLVGVEQSSVQGYGYRVGGNIQGEEVVEGKFLRMWGDSGNVVLEGAHGEAACHNCTADEGVLNWEG